MTLTLAKVCDEKFEIFRGFTGSCRFFYLLASYACKDAMISAFLDIVGILEFA